MSEKKKTGNPRNVKPVSLHPLKLEEALEKALNTKPPGKDDTEEESEEPSA